MKTVICLNENNILFKQKYFVFISSVKFYCKGINKIGQYTTMTLQQIFIFF